MSLNCCLFLILMVPLLTLEANSEDPDCAVEIRVRRSTVHEVSLGRELRINCNVTFCNNSPPTVSWFKREKVDIPVDVSSDSHIKTEWETLNAGEGISYLIFQNILKSDSGVYHCHGGGSVSHGIKVSVHVDESPTMQNNPNVHLSECVPYRAPVVGVFIIIVVIICVTSKCGCKGVRCAERSRDTPDPNPEPSSSRRASPPISDIYEN